MIIDGVLIKEGLSYAASRKTIKTKRTSKQQILYDEKKKKEAKLL